MLLLKLQFAGVAVGNLSGIVCCLDNFLFPALHGVSTQEYKVFHSDPSQIICLRGILFFTI